MTVDIDYKIVVKDLFLIIGFILTIVSLVYGINQLKQYSPKNSIRNNIILLLAFILYLFSIYNNITFRNFKPMFIVNSILIVLSIIINGYVYFADKKLK